MSHNTRPGYAIKEFNVASLSSSSAQGVIIIAENKLYNLLIYRATDNYLKHVTRTKTT